jgi:hypothetical protein
MNDIPIMEIAVKTFNKKVLKMINRCRLFLQLISVTDILIYNTKTIHPAGRNPPLTQVYDNMATISQTAQKLLETVAFFSPPTPRANGPELANSMEQLYDTSIFILLL